MDKIFYLSLFIVVGCRSDLHKSCSYGTNLGCSSDQYCVLLEPGKLICQEKDETYPVIVFPRDPKATTVCTQPPSSRQGRTHSYLNTFYATDLATPKGLPNAKLIAAIDGEVITHDGCDNKDKEDLNNDPCGYGFGNWVIIMNKETKLMAFYAHLRTIKVKDGEVVKRGMIIGEEGKSGQAGHRHLHFSLHRNNIGLTSEKIKAYGIWLPPSIPYLVNVKINGRSSTLKVLDLPCEDSNDLSRNPFFGE